MWFTCIVHNLLTVSVHHKSCKKLRLFLTQSFFPVPLTLLVEKHGGKRPASKQGELPIDPSPFPFLFIVHDANAVFRAAPQPTKCLQ